MSFAFTEEQEALRQVARRFLEKHASSERTRAAMATDPGFEPEVWQAMGHELGWTALTIPEAYGGYGLSHVELIAVMEGLGRAVACAPYFSSVCLAANALLLGGTEAQKEAWLPGIAAGDTIATCALTGSSGRWDGTDLEVTARREGSEYRLEGVAAYVPDGHTADLLIVAAQSAGSSGPDGVELFLVPSTAPGLSRRRLPTMDQTRTLAEVRLENVRVPEASRLGEPASGCETLRAVLRRASVALAAEQLGVAQRCLELAVDYAKVRVQFGRPIGSFQAIKHKCADMMVLVESTRSTVYYAGWAIDSSPAELPELAPLVKAYASDAAFRCAAECIQIHGGIGFTWEHDAHLLFKRARASTQLLGDAAWHREEVARQMGL